VTRQTGLIATIVSIFVVGIPACFCLFFGAVTAAGQGDFNGQPLDPMVGIGLVCLGLLALLIPAGLWLAVPHK
jgi:hypothetical protein